MEFLKLIFGFYSQNFENYKIIKYILNTNNIDIRKNESNNNNKKISNTNDVNKFPLIPPDNKNKKEKNLELAKIKKSTPLIDNNDNEQIMSINDDNNNDILQNVGVDEERINLPKGKVYDFYINNISFIDCCNTQKQNIINVCNDIISKYFSIELIVYNQIKLENLLKDYKWNNPSLNNIENSDEFIKLKTIL